MDTVCIVVRLGGWDPAISESTSLKYEVCVWPSISDHHVGTQAYFMAHISEFLAHREWAWTPFKGSQPTFSQVGQPEQFPVADQ